MFRYITIISILLMAYGIEGCKSSEKQNDRETVSSAAPVGDATSSDLSRIEAQSRKARVSNISYQLKIKIGDQENEFRGFSKITFQLKDAAHPLRVDFFEGKIHSLKLNGQLLPETAKTKYWLELPIQGLKVGVNVLEADFSQAYSKQGQGLHRFKDPKNHEVFMYTQFETFDANRFMPCFDQPDLRATLEMQVEAPANWQIITTTMETAKTAATPGFKNWTFEKTPSLSTYLFSLHAGPYKVWTDQFEDIPLRVFARPSMAPFVPVKEWMRVTKQGLKFFNEYFAYKYPFKKYDQVFVPEFNAGAMENVAAVTFTESYLFRSPPTREQRKQTLETLLHEMAHMWFGDIVTMAWWNDLWLNESFATYMASLALVEATEYRDGWVDFFIGAKTWAYWEDSLRTTHPIEAPILTVKDAFANFDGITYGKGASVLKQLSNYMGAEQFKRGIQQYIRKHAYQNTELKDFIAALQINTPNDLGLWADRWLRQSGTDKLTAQWTCEGGKLKQVVLNTTMTPGAQFRPQTVNVGFYRIGVGRTVSRGAALAQSMRVTLDQPVVTLNGDWDCPQMIYPNLGDHGFVSVQLDATTLKNLKEVLSSLPNDLDRAMIWDDLWQMVRRAEMPLKDYIQIVERHFARENKQVILDQIVNSISGQHSERGTVLYYWPDSELQEKQRFIAKMEGLYLLKFNGAKDGTDEQKFWFDSYLQIARTPLALRRLEGWYKAKSIAPKFQLDPDRKWRIVRQLNRFRRPGAEALIAKMKAEDNSDRGQRQALSAEAIRPDMSIKTKWVGELKLAKPKITFAEVRAVSQSIFPAEQNELAQRFEADFYEYLKFNGKSEEEVFVEAIAPEIAPLNCDAKNSEKLKNFLGQDDLFAPSVKKALLISVDEDERCQKVRQANSRLNPIQGG